MLRVVAVSVAEIRRAGVARPALRLTAFTDVRYLDRHMSGWKERGLPQERSEWPRAAPGSRATMAATELERGGAP